MRKIIILLAMVLGLLSGCATPRTMEEVQNRLGPPAKSERLENGNSIHSYYKACNDYDCKCTEFTYDQTGKLINTRKYWTQGVPDVIKEGKMR